MRVRPQPPTGAGSPDTRRAGRVTPRSCSCMGPAPPCPASRAISTSIARRCGAGCAGTSRRTGRSRRARASSTLTAPISTSAGARAAATRRPWPANSIALGLVSIHERCVLGRRRGAGPAATARCRRPGPGSPVEAARNEADRPASAERRWGDSRRGRRVHRTLEAHCTETGQRGRLGSSLRAHAARSVLGASRGLAGCGSLERAEAVCCRPATRCGRDRECHRLAVVNRTSGGRDQPTEDDQATDVWPRRLRTPASARPQRRLTHHTK